MFIDTLPLTGEDTQASARMAKEAAENFLGHGIDYDILYTIRATSPSISGPSGGAGLAVLAVASYLCLPVNQDMAITGTVNPDGTIGYVGGLEEKIAAAAGSGIGYVVIPYGERIGNASMEEIEGKYNITILQAETVGDAVEYFTGYRKERGSRNEFLEFEELMREIAYRMMQRSTEMANGNWENRTAEIREYYDRGEYYTSSSLSFGLWVDIENARNENLTEKELAERIKQLEESVNEFQSSEEGMFDSYRDVEIYVVFRERLNDAVESLNRSRNILLSINSSLAEAGESVSGEGGEIGTENWTGVGNVTGLDVKDREQLLEEAIYHYSYARQRFETAKIWRSMMDFFSGNVTFGEESLQPLALRRLQMAQAMSSYASTIVGPGFVRDGYREYELAREAYRSGRYALSISHSIKSIASSSLVIELSTSGNISTYLETKRRVVESLLYYSPNPSFISWNYKQLADYYSSKSPYLSAVYYKYATVYSTFYEDIIASSGGEQGMDGTGNGPGSTASGDRGWEVTCRAYETDKRRIVAWILIAWLLCITSTGLGRRVRRIGKALGR